MPAIADPTELRRVALFRGLSLSQLAVLNGLMRRHALPAGARVLMTDQLADTTYVVQSGLVKVVVEQADGGELILAILGASDVIGALTIGESPDGAHSVVPLEDTSLFWIDRHAFERCLQTMPELSANLSGMLARRVRLANDRIEAMAGIDVRTRIVRHLLLLGREYGEFPEGSPQGSVRIPLRLTQGDLARLVGASRVRVNHALSELRRREALETSGDHVLWIRDVSALEKLR
ncbi:Crp/Fnr family transcriptional regulator [Mycolicibacterium sp. BiH015]|nr:Crp/Fnr family transcriptional regulator [Mycolicibacterium sp. BiH015]